MAPRRATDGEGEVALTVESGWYVFLTEEEDRIGKPVKYYKYSQGNVT